MLSRGNPISQIGLSFTSLLSKSGCRLLSASSLQGTDEGKCIWLEDDK